MSARMFWSFSIRVHLYIRIGVVKEVKKDASDAAPAPYVGLWWRRKKW